MPMNRGFLQQLDPAPPGAMVVLFAGGKRNDSNTMGMGANPTVQATLEDGDGEGNDHSNLPAVERELCVGESTKVIDETAMITEQNTGPSVEPATTNIPMNQWFLRQLETAPGTAVNIFAGGESDDSSGTDVPAKPTFQATLVYPLLLDLLTANDKGNEYSDAFEPAICDDKSTEIVEKTATIADQGCLNMGPIKPANIPMNQCLKADQVKPANIPMNQCLNTDQVKPANIPMNQWFLRQLETAPGTAVNIFAGGESNDSNEMDMQANPTSQATLETLLLDLTPDNNKGNTLFDTVEPELCDDVSTEIVDQTVMTTEKCCLNTDTVKPAHAPMNQWFLRQLETAPGTAVSIFAGGESNDSNETDMQANPIFQATHEYPLPLDRTPDNNKGNTLFDTVEPELCDDVSTEIVDETVMTTEKCCLNTDTVKPANIPMNQWFLRQLECAPGTAVNIFAGGESNDSSETDMQASPVFQATPEYTDSRGNDHSHAVERELCNAVTPVHTPINQRFLRELSPNPEPVISLFAAGKSNDSNEMDTTANPTFRATVHEADGVGNDYLYAVERELCNTVKPAHTNQGFLREMDPAPEAVISIFAGDKSNDSNEMDVQANPIFQATLEDPLLADLIIDDEGNKHSGAVERELCGGELTEIANETVMNTGQVCLNTGEVTRDEDFFTANNVETPLDNGGEAVCRDDDHHNSNMNDGGAKTPIEATKKKLELAQISTKCLHERNVPGRTSRVPWNRIHDRIAISGSGRPKKVFNAKSKHKFVSRNDKRGDDSAKTQIEATMKLQLKMKAFSPEFQELTQIAAKCVNEQNVRGRTNRVPRNLIHEGRFSVIPSLPVGSPSMLPPDLQELARLVAEYTSANSSNICHEKLAIKVLSSTCQTLKDRWNSMAKLSRFQRDGYSMLIPQAMRKSFESHRDHLLSNWNNRTTEPKEATYAAIPTCDTRKPLTIPPCDLRKPPPIATPNRINRVTELRFPKQNSIPAPLPSLVGMSDGAELDKLTGESFVTLIGAPLPSVVEMPDSVELDRLLGEVYATSLGAPNPGETLYFPPDDKELLDAATAGKRNSTVFDLNTKTGASGTHATKDRLNRQFVPQGDKWLDVITHQQITVPEVIQEPMVIKPDGISQNAEQQMLEKLIFSQQRNLKTLTTEEDPKVERLILCQQQNLKTLMTEEHCGEDPMAKRLKTTHDTVPSATELPKHCKHIIALFFGWRHRRLDLAHEQFLDESKSGWQAVNLDRARISLKQHYSVEVEKLIEFRDCCCAHLKVGSSHRLLVESFFELVGVNFKVFVGQVIHIWGSFAREGRAEVSQRKLSDRYIFFLNTEKAWVQRHLGIMSNS